MTLRTHGDLPHSLANPRSWIGEPQEHFLTFVVVLLHCFGFRGPDNASLSWQKPESDGGKAISHYQLEVRENKMTDFVKGKVFTIAEVRENKEGQILAKVVF